MQFIFIINGRSDKSFILEDVKKQLQGLDIDYSLYVTGGAGDATRYVRLYCEFHQDDTVCFVSCGGSGTASEVGAGIIGYSGKYMAVMSYGTTNDFLKNFPGADFKSVKALVNSNFTKKIDVIKCNNDYAINVCNVGFDAMVARKANDLVERGAKNAYIRAIISSFMASRIHNFRIVVDGKRISRGLTLLCVIGNGMYYGGEFKCSPRAVTDDGELEVCRIRAISTLGFFRIMTKFKKGLILDDRYCRSRVDYCRGRHIEISSRNLIYACLDGEITASTKLTFDVLEKAISLIIPEA